MSLLTSLRGRAELILRLAETWVRRPRSPTRVVFDVTRRCNLRCRMCRTWEIAPGHELTADEVRDVLGRMPGLTWLDLTGGEPFLRADAAELFDAVLDATPALRVLHFPTNGWFTERTVAVAERVRARRPGVQLIVTVSVDGPPALHDRMRGREGAYARALDTFRALRALPGVDAYVGTTVTRDNFDALDALGARLATDVPGFRPPEWHWNWLQRSAHFFANARADDLDPPPPADLVRAHVRRRGWPRSLVDVMELLFLVNLEFYRRGEPSGVVCQSLRSACFLSPEGDVYPCHVYDRPLGNVRERDFAELWASPEVAAARRDIERLACGGCFTPCEAYPALAGAPLATLRQTARRSLALVRGG